MKSHELTSQIKSKKRKRIARGIAAGGGKTAGRGTKGQGSRVASGNLPIGFEGGQMPLKQRLPKRKGFKSFHSKKYQIVNLGKIFEIFGKENKVDKNKLFKAKLIKDPNLPCKILADGIFDAKMEMEADAFSESAKNKIEKEGGKIILINNKTKPKPTK